MPEHDGNNSYRSYHKAGNKKHEKIDLQGWVSHLTPPICLGEVNVIQVLLNGFVQVLPLTQSLPGALSFCVSSTTYNRKEDNSVGPTEAPEGLKSTTNTFQHDFVAESLYFCLITILFNSLVKPIDKKEASTPSARNFQNRKALKRISF